MAVLDELRCELETGSQCGLNQRVEELHLRFSVIQVRFLASAHLPETISSIAEGKHGVMSSMRCI